MPLKKGDVLEEELFLQVLRAGGDHDALAGEDGGNQVSQRFAGARARFHDQMLAVRQRRFHRFCHGQLAGTVFVIWMPLRKRAVPRAASSATSDLPAPWKPRVNPWLIAMTVALAAFMEVLDTS